ncbi:hypothetical protein BV25DRAFT_1838700 [Artomyces pyxidatus]|uniref:Uncharacterized protein n=1 Tax=Artomyces pyxidatus TaxID=48021 RepID=A0ACB8T155_9AGAM|nr:hypothetical protein BV25DRAFT_1838700 [Artomyces pyxidatus]
MAHSNSRSVGQRLPNDDTPRIRDARAHPYHSPRRGTAQRAPAEPTPRTPAAIEPAPRTPLFLPDTPAPEESEELEEILSPLYLRPGMLGRPLYTPLPPTPSAPGLPPTPRRLPLAPPAFDPAHPPSLRDLPAPLDGDAPPGAFWLARTGPARAWAPRSAGSPPALVVVGLLPPPPRGGLPVALWVRPYVEGEWQPGMWLATTGARAAWDVYRGTRAPQFFKITRAADGATVALQPHGRQPVPLVFRAHPGVSGPPTDQQQAGSSVARRDAPSSIQIQQLSSRRR